MIELIYVSRASTSFYDKDMAQRLENQRINNSRANITGLLLYDGVGTIIQAIEGEEAKVLALFDEIKRDDSQSRINLLWKKKISTRRFTDWKLSYRTSSVTKGDREPLKAGYSDFFQHKSDTAHFLNNHGFVVEMLNHFRSNHS